MTRQVLFIQGGGEGVHDHWDDKLVASLERALGPGYEIRYPLMPDEADPRASPWKKAIGKEIAALDDGAILVGHSVGGTMLISALADRPPAKRLGGVVLVSAPFIGDGGWPSDDIEPMDGLGPRLPAEVDIHLFHGSADETAPLAHVDLYARAIPQAHTHKLEGRDHQLDNDMSEVAAVIKRIG
jgi:predicted alpha/beta hydrolase family esterase